MNSTLYHGTYGVQYYSLFHETVVGLGTYYPRIRGGPPVQYIALQRNMTDKHQCIPVTIKSSSTQISKALTTVRSILAKQSVMKVQVTAGDTVGFKCCPRLFVTVLNTLK